MRIVFSFKNWMQLCFLSENKCRLCLLSSSDGWADVSTPIATRDHNSDGWMTSACLSLLEPTVAMSMLTSSHPSLLQTIVATGVFCPSLLCYHCSDMVVAMGRLPVATVAYNLMLHGLFVVVILAYFYLWASYQRLLFTRWLIKW
jgi:hypothetical protein